MSMNEIERIREQLRHAMEGGAWHGPSVREILAGMTAAEAAHRPIPEAHTSWELVLHVAAWLEIVRRRTEGEEAIPTDAENFPAVERHDEAAWAEARERLDRAHAELQYTLEALEPAVLDRRVAAKDYTVGFMLHGAIQHTLYHAGQIVILKRAT